MPEETLAPQQTPLYSITSPAAQAVRRYFEAERLGGLRIDDQLELVGLIERDVTWLGAVPDLMEGGAFQPIQPLTPFAPGSFRPRQDGRDSNQSSSYDRTEGSTGDGNFLHEGV